MAHIGITWLINWIMFMNSVNQSQWMTLRFHSCRGRGLNTAVDRGCGYLVGLTPCVAYLNIRACKKFLICFFFLYQSAVSWTIK